jgi:hypothetical protein
MEEQEKAFVVASIKKKIESDQKREKEMERKAKKKKSMRR